MCRTEDNILKDDNVGVHNLFYRVPKEVGKNMMFGFELGEDWETGQQLSVKTISLMKHLRTGLRTS